ncbi:MAG: right-handed parallel beta-helix repeat-containing protein, partial [Dehalococcoidales bacterium]|nr:right-handed parallel beta-helix repeat-containing protein [Dehalococcoidales bacterium]
MIQIKSYGYQARIDKMKRKLLYLFVIFTMLISQVSTIFLFPTHVQAQITHENENISTDTVWTAADSPHIISGYITISSGVTLTIEPGCDVLLDQGASITVNGALYVPGTEGNGVTFTRNSAAYWDGLRFQSGSSGNLDYCTIEYSSYGVYAYMPGPLSLDHCTVQNNTYGFYGYKDANPLLTDNTFQDNANTGIFIRDTTSPVIEASNTVSGNGRGIYFDGCTSPQVSCDVSGGATGIHFQDSTSPAVAAGVSVQDATSCGIYYQNSSSLGTIDNLNMTGNGGYGAFRMANSGAFTLAGGNTISGNEWPLTIDAGSFPDGSSSIPTSGNTNNAIRVTSGTGTGTGIWHHFEGLDYVVTESPTVGAAGTLTIDDDNTLRFNQGASITVNGALYVPGTEGNGVTFTRNSAAYWDGLRFQSGSSG